MLFDTVDQPQCKGLILRAHINNYTSDNYIAHGVRLIVAKRKSCPGCSKCEHQLDNFREHQSCVGDEIAIINMNEVDDGEYYKLVTCNHKEDWETGYIDEWDYKLIKQEN